MHIIFIRLCEKLCIKKKKKKENKKKERKEKKHGPCRPVVVLNDLPYDIHLSFMPDGHVADVKHLVC